MKVASLHAWDVNIAEAKSIQLDLASRVCRQNRIGAVRYVAGVDVWGPRSARGGGRAAIVVLSYPELAPVEVQVAEAPIAFPYVPGLLSFREAPLVMAAAAKLRQAPDLLLVDGQGLAHPRRFGIACHLGLLLDVPTIGCAKSRLCGEHASLSPKRGAATPLRDGDAVIGAVVRSRDNVKPLYVSIGHRCDLDAAVQWTLACCRGYRLPEPTRLAHQAAGGVYRLVAATASP